VIRPPVVVVGLDCPTGLQTARIFSRRGIDVIGLAADPSHACARTRACSRLIRVASDPDAIVHALKRLGDEQTERPVLVPCTDLAVLGISRSRDALAQRFRMAVPPPETIEMLLDKARFAAFAAEHRLPVPETHVIRSSADAAAVASKISYPCVLKPALKSPKWEAGTAAKAFLAATPGELRERYRQASAWADVFVAQAWIEGGDTDHYTCDCYLDREGHPLVTFTTRKLRQWPPTVGQGSLSVEHRNDVVRDEAIRVFQAAGHHGLGYLEMKHDAALGRHLVIEANVGRPTGRSAAAERAGVELLMTMYNDLVGLELPTKRAQRFGGTKWIHLRRDAQASVTEWMGGRTSLADVIRSWRGPKAFALLSLRDPWPFLVDLGHALRTVLRGGRLPATEPPSRSAGVAERPSRSAGVAPPSRSLEGTEPPSRSAGVAKPSSRSLEGTEPPSRSAGVAKPSSRSLGLTEAPSRSAGVAKLASAVSPRAGEASRGGAPGAGEASRNGAPRSGSEVDSKPPKLASARVVDFDVHGLVGVRVLDAGPSDLEAVSRDVGVAGSLEGRNPDVIVCFVDELSPRPLALIDGGATAYARDGVYFLDAPGGAPVARVKQGTGWGQALIVCLRGASSVPMLATCVDLAALSKGWVGLHASAWVMGGCGFLAAGWAGSGKTGALLAACDHGARALGDERILLASSGATMAGVGRPIVGHDWHLPQLSPPTIGSHSVRRAVAKATPTLTALADRLADRLGPGLPARAVRKLVARLRRALDVEVSQTRLSPGSGTPSIARPDALILLETHRDDAIVTRRIDPVTAAERLASQVEAELLPALRAQLAFEYALQGDGWSGIRRAPARAARLLASATRNVPCYLVRHPYPCSLDRLHEAISALAPETPVRHNGRRPQGRLELVGTNRGGAG
jgi:D-aspartate ligase